MSDQKGNPFAGIGFEDFRRLATSDGLSRYERIGFPDSYRHGFEARIFEDIVRKLAPLSRRDTTIVDIGPGCSELPAMIIEQATRLGQSLVLVDSQEMLDLLDAPAQVRKVPAFFPRCPELIDELRGKADAVLAYSVLHYPFVDTSLWRFVDSALALLAPGGWCLLGDIPNISMRKRFFSSEAGRRLHREFTGRDEDPDVIFNNIEFENMDDSVVIGLLMRARAAGFHAYVVPQSAELPMANRREDILVHRP